jgi:hypothetical protein
MHIIYLADEDYWIDATLTVQTCPSCLQKIMSDHSPTLYSVWQQKIEYSAHILLKHTYI